MQFPMAAKLSPTGRSVQDNRSDTSKNVIRVIFATVITRVVFCAVLDSSTTAAAGSEPEDDGWKTSEVQRREAVTTVVIAEVMLRVE